jgi:hypothetical protein
MRSPEASDIREARYCLAVYGPAAAQLRGMQSFTKGCAGERRAGGRVITVPGPACCLVW